ncbi:hypothetical protein ANN_05348 [Periplaneta americana]|uniref:Uncharacterized protein n=1 Tax=Periplaneta americana TaxID=6978 RepID=A0ABQ8TCM7_PERAM|nr:hypothetical protein ANN_05348 [Periplaneta americana]
MSPESNTESYPAFAQIGLRENPGKNLNQVTCPDRESNPGHLVSRPDALTQVSQDTAREKRLTGNTRHSLDSEESLLSTAAITTPRKTNAKCISRKNHTRPVELRPTVARGLMVEPATPSTVN